ncbi:hypothetical protein F5Y14DRAFT_412404 [Nemania sp. NC0429]|nr:hypothetical protein F5Y14DRAFT_412404 [Nemania sp. NC0429]
MHIGPYRSLSYESNHFTHRFPPIKRSLDGEFVLPIILAPVVLFVFAPLFYFMYRSWRWERVNGLKPKQINAKEEIDKGFEKAELSSEGSVIVHEMHSPQEAQEMPEMKNGLSHELPGTSSPPQELPAAIHEMSAEGYDKKSNEKNKEDKL